MTVLQYVHFSIELWGAFFFGFLTMPPVAEYLTHIISKRSGISGLYRKYIEWALFLTGTALLVANSMHEFMYSFDESNYIRKTLGVNDNSSSSKKLTETSEAEINGRKVTFRGKDKKIYLATWNHNNFAYTISLDENGSGADIEEMTEYIEATY